MLGTTPTMVGTIPTMVGTTPTCVMIFQSCESKPCMLNILWLVKAKEGGRTSAALLDRSCLLEELSPSAPGAGTAAHLVVHNFLAPVVCALVKDKRGPHGLGVGPDLRGVRARAIQVEGARPPEDIETRP